MCIDVNRKIHVGSREIVELPARRRLEDRVDDICLAGLYRLLCCRPFHWHEVHVDTRLLLPKLPVVDEIAVRVTLTVSKEVGRIVIVSYDTDRLGLRSVVLGAYRGGTG